MTSAGSKVALVGSGFIADVHLQILRQLPHVQVVALVDPQLARAERLARRHGIGAVHASVAAMLAAGGVDVAHVLVPPGLHRAVALECLQGGLHVLVEKPMCLRLQDVDELIAVAQERRLQLGVNHNQTFHPGVLALQGHLAAGRLGRLEHLTVQHHVPLRQLQTGDFGHFLFQGEANVLFEQGVHLFALVHELLGDCRVVAARTGDTLELPAGGRFHGVFDVALASARGTANVRLAFGRGMQETSVQAIGSDGVATVDLQTGTCLLRRKSRWLPVVDQTLALARGAGHLAAAAAATWFGYAAQLFGLRASNDPYLVGMRGSLRAFHAAVRSGRPAPCGGSAGRAVVQLCLDTAAAAGLSTTPPAPRVLPAAGAARPGEVVVLGGNGYLGRHCVRALLAAGRPVTLLLRRPQLLPTALATAGVRVVAGDAADPQALAAAFAGADCVLHLATAAGDDAATVATAMPAAVRAAGVAAAAAKVRRLVYASSIAALWLGGRAPVDGRTGPDPLPAQRGAYAQGKIAAEAELARLAAAGLPVVVVRPGIVLGDGGALQHSGLGLWVTDNHCIGWGLGRTPLPLVLAADCAAALVAALTADGIDGRAYNLAGPVRPSARELVAELRRRSGNDLHFHPTPVWWMWLQELGRYAIKALARRERQWPARRDLRSRSCRAPLDCRDAGRDLGFRPEADRERFLQRLFTRPSW